MRKKMKGMLAVAAIILNVLGWYSKRFCDWYVQYVFPLLGKTYGGLTSILPFSVGEAMIAIGIFLLFTSGIMLFFYIFGKKKKRQMAGKYLRGCTWVLIIVCLVMTLNCSLLYHVSPLEETYLAGKGKYGDEELRKLRDYVVVQINELSQEVERDSKGDLTYDGNMGEQARIEMRKLGTKFQRLKGHYPNPKGIYFSDFLSQQYMMGYYFPFAMEATYNQTMYVVNVPYTMCHELAHVKGFIYEDEANFFGYLACVQSEEAFFRYSGYMGVINYIEKDFKNTIKSEEELKAHPTIHPLVKRDDIFLKAEDWERIEERKLFDTNTVNEISNNFTETTLVLNGVSDGMRSYHRVVQLLLAYYDGILY